MNKARFVKAVSLLILCISVSSVSFFASRVVAAPSASNYQESGVYPRAPSYTVWREGSTYFAKDAYGALLSDAGSSNASYVINTAITNAPTNGSIYFIDATYSLSAPLLFNRNFLSYLGASKTGVRFVVTGDFNAINITTGASNLQHVSVKNIHVQGTGAANTKRGFYIYAAWYSVFENLEATGFGYGFYLDGDVTNTGGGSSFTNIIAHNNNYDGIRGWYHYDSFWSNIATYENSQNGLYLAPTVQGWFLQFIKSISNTWNGIVIDGTAAVTIIKPDLSENLITGIDIRDGCKELVIDNAYIEASHWYGVEIKAGQNSPAYNISGITITNSRIVKNYYEGIKIGGINGYNVTNVKISNTDLLNNGQSVANTYWGIYMGNDTDTASSVRNVWIVNVWSANSYFAVGGATNTQIGGIGADPGTQVDYIQVSDCDTQNNLTYGIILHLNPSSALKTYSHVTFSWNLTTWVP